MKQITETHFYRFAKCPMWIYRDAHHEEDREQIEVLQRHLQKDGLLPEAKRSLLADRGFEEVEEEDMDEAFRKTVALMEDGVQTILHGVLVDGRYVARPDVLERVEGRSRFGNHYYVACDIRVPRSIRKGALFTGAFYADVLALIQGARPQQGYVMDPEGQLRPFLIDDVQDQYRLTLHRIERILAGEEPGEFLSSRCKASPWFDQCVASTHACDHLSRVNRILQSEVDMLERAGVSTVAELADAALSDLSQTDLTEERLEMLRAQAQVLVSGEERVLESVDIDTAPVELFFDIEADSLRDLDYLFGILEVKKDKAGRRRKMYKAFLAEDVAGEREAWEGFVAYVLERPDAPIYHYGWYEVEVVRRMCARYGTSPQDVEAILARMIDVLGLMRGRVLFPLSFYSLKDIAQYLGFSWRHPEASGANSILWYEAWLQKQDEQKLKDVVEYNEDDVRATHVLVDWLQKHATSL